jgi:hypothetical protein
VVDLFWVNAMHAAIMRLRSLLLACVAVGVGLAVVDVGLRCALGADPGWMPPRFYNYARHFGDRIARVELMKRAGQVDEKRLVVVMGTSSVQFGLDPGTLEQNDPLGRHWLVLGTSGASILNVGIDTEPFMDSSLHPSVILVAMHVWMLHRDDHIEHRSAPSSFDRISWLGRHHLDLENLLVIECDRAFLGVGRLLNRPYWEIYTPAQDPWRERFDFQRDHLPPSDLAWQWESLQFESAANQYQGNDYEVNCFCRLIRQLREHCQRVVCVLMPESSPLRPDATAAEASFRQAVAALGQGLEIVDLRASMPDSMLYDYNHLNSAGRAKFSAMLPSIIH